MSEFKLERFKYNWKGVWSNGNAYNRDDVVNVGGKTYVCLITHTSSADFNTDLKATVPGSSPPVPQPKWVLQTDGRRWIGSWVTATQYQEGDIVTFDGTVYFCNLGHLSTTFQANATDWTIIAQGTEFQTDWTTGAGYGPGAIVKYNGILYKCITAHTSQTYLEDDIASWQVFHDGIYFAGNWTTATTYRKNDLVKFGGSIFRVKTTHITTANFDQNLYDIELPGFNDVQEYSGATDYATGDIVRYGGDLYYVTNPIRGIEPTNTGFDSVVYFIKMLYSYNFRGDWNIESDYAPGDLVRRGGELYKALVTIKRENDSTDAVLTDYTDTTKWELVVPGDKFANYWNYNSISYSKGEVVTYYGILYECTQPHTSSTINFPGNGSGYPWWSILAMTTGNFGLNAPGDILTYDKLIDGSSLGPTNVPIGTTNQVLSIRNELTTDPDLYYRDLFTTEVTVVYVSPTGVDDYSTTGGIVRGIDMRYPFKTIRFACQYVEDNITGPCKVAISTGRYIETCPIVVPRYTVVMGDELRSVTVVANSPVTEYTGDTSTTFSYLTRFTNIINDLFLNQDITVTTGNTVAQDKTQSASTGDLTAIFGSLVADITEYLSYKILSGSTQPSITGTNTLTSEIARIRASEILRVNTKFLQAEAVAYIKSTSPEYVFTDARIEADVNQFIRGIRYDLRYPGNYATVQSARYYVNQTNGSQLEDMFYLRDITGLRNCTIEGLSGALSPAGTSLILQRPTGGSFCSLDPGWGPADDRTWIATRSPYIQGVTTIGTACTGQKIDGALHNGGNKSMVSNDFTQVISDGLGAHITNNGRAELVSVFTYYAHMGYLAEAGGKIRATNGNNSYGNYGSVALGIDSTETPKTATVDNRNNEAEVAFAFAGEVTDKILAFEYRHCGENYTSASINVVGSGNFVNTSFDDIRDDSLFEARLIQADDSANIGGANYTNVGNNAQTGNTTSITLASNDSAVTADYVGQLIVLTSGVGTGQYGYIQAYNDSTKVAQIYKHTDGTAGWDHIIPGFEISASLQTNTQYRIQPRITVSEPPFTVNTRTLPNSMPTSPKEWVDAAWGETREQYDNNVMSTGTGTTIDTTPAPAVIRIIKTGATYTAVLQSTGIGYAVGDTTTIAGTALGGTSPTNDCIIRVASVSDDSTNSIVTVTVQGSGFAGRWLAVAEGNYSAYSDDGTSWSEIFTASTQTWKTIAHGGTTFVAISNTVTDVINYSRTGKTWAVTTLPSSAPLKDIHYANGQFIIVCEDDNRVFYSANGTTWAQTSIPASTSDDLSSSSKQWQGVSYGYGKWVALSGSDRAIATSSDGITWTVTEDKLPTPGGAYDWCNLTFGNGRFVAVSKNTGQAIYCIGDPVTETWQTSNMPNLDDSTHMNWNKVRYGNGVFFAVCDTGNRIIAGDATTGPTTIAASSPDGYTWTKRDLTFSNKFSSCAYGKYNKNWLVLAKGGNTALAVGQGAKAKVIANISTGVIGFLKIWDPGSGYTSAPTLTIFDNKGTTDAQVQMRIGDGVLAQPTFINRGIGYRTSTTTVTLTGDGYADKIPSNSTDLTVVGLSGAYPGPGAQISITGVMNTDTTEDLTDLRAFTAVKVTELGDDGSGNGTNRVLFRISPKLENSDNLAHGTAVSIRELYSQCRISGHDLLDIGSGNFTQTNYPELYVAGNVFDVYPENETFEDDGGRVFYTSTDQDGNFRAGELFSVEQGTGIVTISADFFDLDGLSELALGGVRLGGSGTVVREFSTDPLFIEDSNNIVPTQKAVVTFLATRLSEGGSEIETNDLTAGLVKIGGENDIIEHTGDGGLVSGTVPGTAFEIQFPKTTNFAGQYAGVTGMPLAMRLFLKED